MRTVICVVAGSMLFIAQAARAVKVHPSELAEAGRFVAGFVQGQPVPTGIAAFLIHLRRRGIHGVPAQMARAACARGDRRASRPAPVRRKPTPRRACRSAAWPSSTATSRRSSGRSTSRTPARPTRRSSQTSRRSTPRFERGAKRRVRAAPQHRAARARRTTTSRSRRRSSPRQRKRITAAGGRPTQQRSALLQPRAGPAAGVIVVVGWPGQWAADFARDAATRPAHSRRPGADALQAAPRRGGPHAADRAAVLARRLDRARRTSGGAGCSPTTCPGPAASCRPCSWPRAARTSSAR